jgi:hypothetical protein
MLTARNIDALIDDTTQYFAERRWLMSRDEGPRQRRNDQRRENLRRFGEHLREGTAEQWIAEMVDATLDERGDFDAVLRDIGARFAGGRMTARHKRGRRRWPWA